MRQNTKPKRKNGMITDIGRRWVLLVAVLAVCGCSLGYVVRAYTRRSAEHLRAVASTPSAVSQMSRPLPTSLLSRLRLQPVADRLRRRLGQRFSNSGLGVSVLLGTLTIGDRREAIRITRAQDDGGEQVEIAIGSEPATLTWNADDGTKAGAATASVAQRSLVERLVLDSADQFIYAQLRGAAYNTMAQQVRPAEAGDSDEYEGPVWDLVRVIESTSRSSNQPESAWRIYYIDCSTGLIDRILSQENGENLIAQLSSWIEQDGEFLPAKITWTKNKQILMELSISSVSHSAR